MSPQCEECTARLKYQSYELVYDQRHHADSGHAVNAPQFIWEALASPDWSRLYAKCEGETVLLAERLEVGILIHTPGVEALSEAYFNRCDQVRAQQATETDK